MKCDRASHQLQRQFETEVPPGGFGVQKRSRPRLTARWVVGDTGKLICQWHHTE